MNGVIFQDIAHHFSLYTLRINFLTWYVREKIDLIIEPWAQGCPMRERFLNKQCGKGCLSGKKSLDLKEILVLTCHPRLMFSRTSKKEITSKISMKAS